MIWTRALTAAERERLWIESRATITNNSQRGLVNMVTVAGQTDQPNDVISVSSDLHLQAVSSGQVVCNNLSAYGSISAGGVLAVNRDELFYAGLE